jgi:hypothetical protein
MVPPAAWDNTCWQHVFSWQQRHTPPPAWSRLRWWACGRLWQSQHPRSGSKQHANRLSNEHSAGGWTLSSPIHLPQLPKMMCVGLTKTQMAVEPDRSLHESRLARQAKCWSRGRCSKGQPATYSESSARILVSRSKRACFRALLRTSLSSWKGGVKVVPTLERDTETGHGRLHVAAAGSPCWRHRIARPLIGWY